MTRYGSWRKGYDRILFYLDSNHTYDHVLAELVAHAPLTSLGSYCVVFYTIVEDMLGNMFSILTPSQ